METLPSDKADDAAILATDAVLTIPKRSQDVWGSSRNMGGGDASFEGRGSTGDEDWRRRDWSS